MAKDAQVAQDISQEEQALLRKNALEAIHRNIQQLEELEREVTREKSSFTRLKKQALSAIGQSQVSKAELVRQLKRELQNLVLASENDVNPPSGAVLAEKMFESMDKFLKQEKKRTDRNPPLAYRKFIDETNLLLKCQDAHALLRKYANDSYGYAQKHFQEIIFKQSRLPKNKDKPSKALELRTKTGDFLALFYPTRTEPRDQLVIDSFREFSESEANKKTELYAIGAIMADLNSFQITLERIGKAKKQLKNDPASLEMALDSFLEADLMRKYDAIMDPKAGLIRQIQDPKVRKKLLDSLREIKAMILEDLPKEYKQKKKLQIK